MLVNDIRDRIVELSHQSSGDGAVQAKALGWLNAAYMELMNELLAFAPQALQRTETVSVSTTGLAALSVPPNRILRVLVDGVPVPMVRTLDLLEADPTQTATGTPELCAMVAGGVQLQPRQSGTAVVLFVPQPVTLGEGGAESSILLAPSFHDALVWGGLVWSSLFERGFASASELALFGRQWQEAKARIKLALLHTAGAALRVAPGFQD